MRLANIPIVFIHRSYSPYLHFSLSQARETAREVVLIDDRKNRPYGSFYRHEYLEEFLPAAAEFDRHYLNLSSHSYAYEHFCFQRWFLLAAFMRKHGLEQAIHLDTDILLYRLPSLPDGPWGLATCGESGHVCVVRSLAALEEFCDFCLDLYRDPDKLAALFERYRTQAGDPEVGGITDMTAFDLFRKARPGFILDLETETNLDGRWDLTYYRIIRAREKGEDPLRGSPVNMIHFQGTATKALMPRHASSEVRRGAWRRLLVDSLGTRRRRTNIDYLLAAWHAR